jgi:hypothetical protein
MKNNYHHPTFIQYKKILINLFSLQYEKQYYTREKEKNSRGKKIKNINLK